MTRDRQARPSTSAGLLSSPCAPPRRSIGVKTDDSSPEAVLERDGAPPPPPPHKASKTRAERQRRQAALLDGLRHVTAVLRADEQQLHEQLLVASEKGNHRAVYLLLHQHLVDKDRCRGMRGFSPLHHAAARGHLEVLRLLLGFGWPVDTRTDALETALHLASFGGHARAAECLLDRGADADARTRDLETPLFYAARKGHARVVRLLVRRECDVSARNRLGDVAEDEAADAATRQELEVASEDAARIRRDRERDRARASKPADRATDERALSQQTRERVLSFLDVQSLGRAAQVAFRWHRAADSPSLWRRLGVSRWELQLHSSMGLGASVLASLSMLTARRSGSRPTSCDHAASRFLQPRIPPKQRAMTRDDARPQTAGIV